MIQAFARFVIFINVEHCLFDAFFFEVDKAFRTDSFTNSFSCFVGVNADYVELADGILVYKVAMDLGPTKACDFAVVNTQEETLLIKPRFLHSVLEIFHDPITLVRVVGKDEIVEF